MTKREKYNDIVKKLKSCKNILELKNISKEINDFVKKYNVSPFSSEYKKIEDLEKLIKIKLKKRMTESKVIRLDESTLYRIIVEVIQRMPK